MSITIWDMGDQFCGKCHMTKRAFDKSAVAYSTRDLTDPQNADRLESFKAAGHTAFPIVETPDDLWSDYRPERIQAAANKAHIYQAGQVLPGANLAGPSAF